MKNRTLSNKERFKHLLIDQLISYCRTNQLKQIEMANKLNITQPRLSSVFNRQLNKLTVDYLIDLVDKLNLPIILIGQSSEKEL